MILRDQEEQASDKRSGQNNRLAKGFDLVAGSLVVARKESWAELAVLPFEGHDFSSEPWRPLHLMVLSASSNVVTLPRPPRSILKPYYFRRDDRPSCRRDRVSSLQPYIVLTARLSIFGDGDVGEVQMRRHFVQMHHTEMMFSLSTKSTR